MDFIKIMIGHVDTFREMFRRFVLFVVVVDKSMLKSSKRYDNIIIAH